MAVSAAKKASGSKPVSKLSQNRGVFITFEGGEGAGKTHQIKQLAKLLEQFGNSVLETREPGGSPGAEAVRHVLLSGAAEPLGAEMETILFFAARSDNVETIIKPALDDNQIVLCDRFYDSTRVYQGKVGEVSERLIDRLIEVACEDARPDLTIILDIDPKIGLARLQNRDGEQLDRFEKDELALQKARREGFLEIAKAEPERCRVIDASQDEKKVFAKIEEAVVERFPELFARAARADKAAPKAKTKTAAAGKATAKKASAQKAKTAKATKSAKMKPARAKATTTKKVAK